MNRRAHWRRVTAQTWSTIDHTEYGWHWRVSRTERLVTMISITPPVVGDRVRTRGRMIDEGWCSSFWWARLMVWTRQDNC